MPMDPATIQAIAQAAGALFSLMHDGKVGEWQDSVSSKLDYIILQNALILERLEEIKRLIPEAMHREFRENETYKFHGLSARFGAYLEDIDANKRLAFPNLQFQTEQWSLDLARYGSSVFPSMFGGAGILVAIFKILKTDTDQQKDILRPILAHFTEWAADEAPGSISAAIVERQNAVKAGLARIEAQRGVTRIATHTGSIRTKVGKGGDGGDVLERCNSGVSGKTMIDDQWNVTVTEVGLDDPQCSSNFVPAKYAKNQQHRVESLIKDYQQLGNQLKNLQDFYAFLLDCIKKLQRIVG